MAEHVRLSVDDIEFPAVIIDAETSPRSSVSFRIPVMDIMKHLADPSRFGIAPSKIMLSTWREGNSEVTEIGADAVTLSMRLDEMTSQVFVLIDFQYPDADLSLHQEYWINA